MRCLSIATAIVAFTVALAQMASAAAPQAQSWTGLYAGLNAGGNWGDDPVSTTASNSEFCPICSHALETATASLQGATGVFPVKTDGFIGGGQLGYNLQIADRWVAGFEADFQGLANAEGSATNSAVYNVSGFAAHSVSTDMSVTKRIDTLGTVRGRLGYQVMPNVLVFGTGGFAYGHAKSSLAISQNFNGSGLGAVETSFGTNLSASETLGGWALGGGFEWMFSPKWSAKVGYLHYDLGKMTTHGQIADRFVAPSPPTPNYWVNNVQSTTHFNGDIASVGVNYHF